MDWFEFLSTLENTLNQIEIKGKQNIDYMSGCFIAIEKAKQSLLKQQMGGEKNGRQTDISTDGSDNNK